jgi:hypothetical protein
MNEFRTGYHSINNLIHYLKHVVLADFHNILNRWANYVFQQFIYSFISDVE